MRENWTEKLRIQRVFTQCKKSNDNPFQPIVGLKWINLLKKLWLNHNTREPAIFEISLKILVFKIQAGVTFDCPLNEQCFIQIELSYVVCSSFRNQLTRTLGRKNHRYKVKLGPILKLTSFLDTKALNNCFCRWLLLTMIKFWNYYRLEYNWLKLMWLIKLFPMIMSFNRL